MATTCSVAEHPPVEGKGYFVLSGDRLQASMSELVKHKPWVVLQGPRGCGYLGCKSSFYDSIGSFLSQYPQVVKCQARQPLHDVDWSDPNGDGCKDHANSPYWSQVLVLVELEGIYGLPKHLIDFSTFLKGGQSGPLSGSGSGPPAKVGARALKIKKLKSDNVIFRASMTV